MPCTTSIQFATGKVSNSAFKFKDISKPICNLISMVWILVPIAIAVKGEINHTSTFNWKNSLKNG